MYIFVYVYIVCEGLCSGPSRKGGLQEVLPHVCSCICIYIYIYVYVFMYTYIDMNIYMLPSNFNLHSHDHDRLCSHSRRVWECIKPSYTCLYMYVYIYMNIYLYKYIFKYSYLHVYIYIDCVRILRGFRGA
jgi:hypothetical protein